ncbi:MAG: hypothetical protein HQ457_00480 [Betaproteobacteria bacterium]|nr:hypothetical protein [Betaproteobacteria bacterium]
MRLLIPLSVSFPEIPPEVLAKAGFRKSMMALRAIIYKKKRHPGGWR